MRFLLLTARPDLAVNSRLTTAAASLGAEALVLDATRVASAVGDTPMLVDDVGGPLEPLPQAVLARVGNWRPESILAALEVAVAAGAATPNPPESIRIARDHWRTAHTLAGADLPVPPAVSGSDPEALARRAARLGFPVVVKQRRSRMGVGVIKIETRDHLEAVLDSLWRLGDEVMVQTYVPTGGSSLRVLVVGGRVVAAARCCAPDGDWRSNAARGGSMTAHDPSAREIELALDAAQALGLGVCGVDLLPGDRVEICEVNPTPGFVHLEKATGVDIAQAIVRDLIRRAEG
jgi:RimK family alpha-L-glutamate ligase